MCRYIDIKNIEAPFAWADFMSQPKFTSRVMWAKEKKAMSV